MNWRGSSDGSGRRRRPAVRFVLGALAAVAVASGGAPPATAVGVGLPGPKGGSSPGGESAVAMSPSATRPYYACASGACEAIIDPPAVRDARGYQLPDGTLLEGSGEKGGLAPQDLRSAYRIPVGGGATQTIAVVDAYGYAAAESDLAKYRARYGLGPCTKANGCFRKVNEKGEEGNYPGGEVGGWVAEASLDLDMASAACAECRIMLVQASSEFEPDTGESVNTAARLGATEISNSYGYPEDYAAWCGTTGCAQYGVDYAHAGVVVIASAGDSGYDDYWWGLAAPNFPASSPNVLAVGGTSLRKAANARGYSEEVWNEPGRRLGTGSGCSGFELKPSWQGDPACAMRTDNDVAAVAACETPVSVYSSDFGGWENLCGTSASAPLLAGMIAHEDEATRALGAAAYYQSPGSLYDVTVGSNGVCAPPAQDEYFCRAEVGYDGPTGLGAPQGAATPPTVTSVSPSEGPPAGATSVTVTGTNFTGVTAVSFGSVPATSFTVSSTSSITAVSPAGSGSVDVTVTTTEGTSVATASDRFSYAYLYPELGRCVKVSKGAGIYKNAGCTTPATGGNYQWLPGFAKAGFTQAGGKTKLETAGKVKIECAAESARGEYFGARFAKNVRITFSGCQLPKLGGCSSSGAAAGEIVSAPLEGALQWESRPALKVAWDLFPVGGLGSVAVFQCASATVEVQGSVLASLAADKMASSRAVKLVAKRGVQRPAEYETPSGRTLDVLEASVLGAPFEWIGLSVSGDVQTSEEPLEVNAIV